MPEFCVPEQEARILLPQILRLSQNSEFCIAKLSNCFSASIDSSSDVTVVQASVMSCVLWFKGRECLWMNKLIGQYHKKI